MTAPDSSELRTTMMSTAPLKVPVFQSKTLLATLRTAFPTDNTAEDRMFGILGGMCV